MKYLSLISAGATVTSIIYQDVNARHLAPKCLPELWLLLISNEDLCMIIFIYLATCVNVTTINVCVLDSSPALVTWQIF